MALQGKLILLANKSLAIECDSANYSDPTIIRHVWQIDTYRLSGMSCCAMEDAIGKPASIQDGVVSCYLGQGNWLRGNLKDGGSTVAISVTEIPVPKPRVRGTTETRWYSGQWQKMTRKGWVAA